MTFTARNLDWVQPKIQSFGDVEIAFRTLAETLGRREPFDPQVIKGYAGASTGRPNEYILHYPFRPNIAVGDKIRFIPSFTNTGAATVSLYFLNSPSFTAKPILQPDGATALAAGNIISGIPTEMMWNGDSWLLLAGGFGGSLVGDNETYGAGWDSDLTFPTKNALYDKIETLISDAAYGSGWNGVTGTAPSKNAVYDQIQTLLGLIPSFGAGTYTPTLSNVANLDGSTPYVNMYLELHTRMLVVGIADVNPTAATATQLGISLPTASNFAAITDCIGLAASPAVTQCGGIYADTTNDRAELLFNATDTGNRSIFYAFMYRLI